MNNEITKFSTFTQLKNLSKRVQQISYSLNATEKRFPIPAEALTESELENITRLYLAFGIEIQNISEEFAKIYDEYKAEEKKSKS